MLPLINLSTKWSIVINKSICIIKSKSLSLSIASFTNLGKQGGTRTVLQLNVLYLLRSSFSNVTGTLTYTLQEKLMLKQKKQILSTVSAELWVESGKRIIF